MNDERLTVYTDGSCTPNPGKGGWGYIAILPDCEVESCGGEKKSTNNIMELTAVIEVLRDFDSRRKFLIITDSLYVINQAKGLWKRNKNKELWEEFDTYSYRKDIIFQWVKGHSGDEYNERVDQLAKKGAREA